MKTNAAAEIKLQKCSFPIVNGIEQKTVDEETVVFGEVANANRAEYYGASQAGYRADIIFEIWAFEYDDQQIILHDGKEYKVIRAYRVNADKIQLTCQRIEGLWGLT